MLTQYEEKMQKSVENLEAEYATIRAGRANPNILNRSRLSIMEFQHLCSSLQI